MGLGKSCVVVAVTLLATAGCTNFGAQQVAGDQFDYNRAIARSMQEQMLLNVVRLRYFEAPVFLTVSSVLTQYAWQGALGTSGQAGFGIGEGLQAPSFVGGSAGLTYVERPTVTFLPVEGEDFSRRMLKPLPLDFVFALQEAGYATDLLFRAGINRINEVQNMGVSGVPAPGDVDRERQAAMELDNLRRFQNLITIMLKLHLLNAIEVQSRTDNDEKQRFLVISPRQSPEVQALIDEFKSILGLDPARNVYRITERRVGRAADEITIQTRSVFQIMGFMAQGVEVPAEQRFQTRPFASESAPTPTEDGTGVPFRVRATKSRPTDAFVATEYNGYWFSLANTDIQSKRGFNLLVYGFRLLAPEKAGSAPALTLPTGP